MAWETTRQATEAIKRSRRVLIVVPENPNPDTLAAASAILSFLDKQNIQSNCYSQRINPERVPQYLNARDRIRPDINGLSDLKIRLDISRAPIKELTYDVVGDKLEITLVPKQGEWRSKDVQIMSGEDHYQAIVAIGFPDRQSFNSSFNETTDIIHRLPIINLDHDAKNENWASINAVDIACISNTEVIYGWLESWDEKSIDDQIATAILSGMISNTNSFRTPNVTPLTLLRAAKLMDLGADRQAIVHGLWRTRRISTLKLWGRALSRLEQDRTLGLVWTTLSRQDIMDSGTTEARLDDLVNELIALVPEAKLTAIFVEHDRSTTRMALFAQSPLQANLLGRTLGLDGSHARASGALARPLMEAKDYAIESLRQQLK